MTLRDLIAEASRLMGEQGDVWHPDADRGYIPPKKKQAPQKPCPPGTVRKMSPSGAKSCVSLRGQRIA